MQMTDSMIVATHAITRGFMATDTCYATTGTNVIESDSSNGLAPLNNQRKRIEFDLRLVNGSVVKDVVLHWQTEGEATHQSSTDFWRSYFQWKSRRT